MAKGDIKQLNRREFLRLAAAGMAGVALTGCAAPATPAAPAPPTSAPAANAGPTTAPTASQGGVKLTFWSWQKHDGELAKAYMDKNPGVTIETTIGGPWDLQDKLVAALAAGTGAPDVARIIMRMFYKFGGKGKGMWDITDRAQQYKGDAPEWAWALLTTEGRIYGLPSENNLCGLFYRKDIFDKYNLKPAATWAEYIEQGKEILDKEKAAMLPLWAPGGQWASDHFRMYLQNRGGNIFAPEGKLIENNNLAKDTLRWYFDLRDKHKIGYPTAIFQPEFYAAMNASKFVTWPMNSGDIVSMKKNCPDLSDKWGRAPMPLWDATGPKYNAELGSSGVAIPEQGKNKEEAWKFVQFYAVSQEGQTMLWEKGNQIPSFKPALESKEVYDKPDPYFGSGTLRDFLHDRETPIFYYVGWFDAAIIIGNQLDAMWAGKASPEDTWDNIERELKVKGIGV